jgi:hypothetical protein
MIMAFHTTLLIPHRFNAYLRLTRARAGRSSALSSAIAPAAISSKSGRSGARSRCGAMPMSPNGPSDAPSWLRIPAGRCFAPRKRKSIGSEFERLFKPAPFMPVKNFTSADEFVEMRVCRSHTGVPNRFLEIYAAEGLPVQLRHLGNCIGYFRSVDGRVDELLHLGAMPISTIGSSDARRYSPTGFQGVPGERRAALFAAGHSSAKLFLAPLCDPRQRCDIGAAQGNRGAYARHSASASRATSARREAREVISWYRFSELNRCRRAALRAAAVFWLRIASKIATCSV